MPSGGAGWILARTPEISDARRVQQRFDWRPTRSVANIVEDVHAWLQESSETLEAVLR